MAVWNLEDVNIFDNGLGGILPQVGKNILENTGAQKIMDYYKDKSTGGILTDEYISSEESEAPESRFELGNDMDFGEDELYDEFGDPYSIMRRRNKKLMGGSRKEREAAEEVDASQFMTELMVQEEELPGLDAEALDPNRKLGPDTEGAAERGRKQAERFKWGSFTADMTGGAPGTGYAAGQVRGLPNTTKSGGSFNTGTAPRPLQKKLGPSITRNKNEIIEAIDEAVEKVVPGPVTASPQQGDIVTPYPTDPLPPGEDIPEEIGELYTPAKKLGPSVSATKKYLSLASETEMSADDAALLDALEQEIKDYDAATPKKLSKYSANVPGSLGSTAEDYIDPAVQDIMEQIYGKKYNSRSDFVRSVR